MKKITLAVSAIAVLATSSLASATHDPRRELDSLWANGSVPKAQEIKSIWLGRCFHMGINEPQTLGALLIGHSNSDRNGPLFEKANDVRYLIQTHGSPEKYDNFPARDFRNDRPWVTNRGYRGGFSYAANDLHYDFDDAGKFSENSAYVSSGGYVMDTNEKGETSKYWMGEHLAETVTTSPTWNIRKNGKHLLALKSDYVRDFKPVREGKFLNKRTVKKMVKNERRKIMICYFYEDLLN